MTRRFLWAAALSLVLIGAGLALGLQAFAQQQPAPSPLGQGVQHHHPFHEDFYRGWMRPDVSPPASCCNARIETNGIESGDCEPTQAEVRKGQWWVWVRQIGRWLPVPDAKIIHVRNPNVVDAHLCWTPANGIMCFSPPDTGG